MMSDTQTAYAMALEYSVVTEPRVRQAMGDRLAELVRAAGYRVATGFVGTPIVCDALTATGHVDVAGRLLLQTENPSWLYPVTMGATTVWERWDSMLEDGSINPGQMTSFNHYAFGGVADWLHRSVAGLAPAAPGYRRLVVAPQPLADLDWARASLETPYGRAAAGWERTGGTVVVTAEVPAGTTAVVRLPDGSEELTVGSGSHRWTVPAGAPPAEPGEVSMDSELADVIDDQDAYRAVMDVLRRYDDELALEVRDTTRWVRGRRLVDTMRRVPPSVQDGIADALAQLSRSRA